MKNKPNWLLNILFWSVISAAFIGPGTVTTAPKAGAGFGYALLWAILFSTLACIVLQEAAARITIASGMNLGEALHRKYNKENKLRWIALFSGGAVIFGGMAYQAGNILGAISGAALVFDLPPWIFTVIITIICGAVLWFGRAKQIAKALGMLVALMGVVFIVVALRSNIDYGAAIQSTFIPSVPEGSAWLVMGLIGTTIVPYNLFLGSGISEGQSIREMRTGLIIAILLGGAITTAVLVTGTQIEGDFSFQAIADSMSRSLGNWAGLFFALGLFAAGFTSSITAPLAGAITARSVFGKKADPSWDEPSRNYRLIWGLVLGTGFLFGVLQVKPIPAIIAAQALNGLLLPFISVFLLLIVNDRNLMPEEHRNKFWQNLLMLVVTFVTLALGLINLMKAGMKILGVQGELPSTALPWVLLIAFALTALPGWKVLRA